MSEAAWANFQIALQGGQPEHIPVVLGADSTFIPAAFGMNTLDFFMYPDRWLNAQLTLMARFPNAVFLPDFWVEFGIANEPSAYGTPILWRHDESPATRHLRMPLEDWQHLPRPDPYSDGLMALVLRRYWNLEHEGELPEPYRIHFVAARGPFTIATHLFGASTFLAALNDPDTTELAAQALNNLTETTIRFLQAQLSCLREPWGIIVLDDTIGMLAPDTYKTFAHPVLTRIFSAFDGLYRLYHNDTPCRHLFPYFRELDFEVLHFSHKIPIAEARALLGPDILLMGNVPPLEIMTYGSPEQVEAAARECIAQADGQGLILAPGGGTNGHTPAENIDALIQAALY